MAGTTGIFDNHGYVTKISTMPHCRFNTDFHGDADDGKRINAAIAQRDVQRCPFERGHSDFVEDGFTRQWIQLRNEVKSRGVPQEPGLTSSAEFTRCQAIATRN